MLGAIIGVKIALLITYVLFIHSVSYVYVRIGLNTVFLLVRKKQERENETLLSLIFPYVPQLDYFPISHNKPLNPFPYFTTDSIFPYFLYY